MNEDLIAEAERRINELMRSNERRLIESQLEEVSVGGIILPPSRSQPERPWSNHIEGSWATTTAQPAWNTMTATPENITESLRRVQEAMRQQQPLYPRPDFVPSSLQDAWRTFQQHIEHDIGLSPIRNPPPTVPNITADEFHAAMPPGGLARPMTVVNNYGPTISTTTPCWNPGSDDPPNGTSAPIVNETSEEIERRIAEMAARVRDLFLQGSGQENYTPRRGDIASLTDNGWVLAGRNISLDVNTEGQAHSGHMVYEGERWIAGLTSMTPGWRDLHPGDIAVNINGDWYLQGLGRMVATGIVGTGGEVAFYDGTSWSLQGTTTTSQPVDESNWKKLTDDDDWDQVYYFHHIGRFRISMAAMRSNARSEIEGTLSILSMTYKNGMVEYVANGAHFFSENTDMNNAPLYDVRYDVDSGDIRNFGIIEERTQHERAIVL